MKQLKAFLYILVTAAVIVAKPAFSQNANPLDPISHLPALAGDYFPMHSIGLNRDFHIFVRLPENYKDNPNITYPVIYVLDGDSLFPLLAPTHLFLTYDENIPEAIVIGIAYGGFAEINKRNKDFTPLSSDSTSDQGGAAEFLQFLKGELIPRVERNYRADSSRRILLGQSRGAQFVLWSALNDPDLFWARIASNPVFVPGKQEFFKPPSHHKNKDLMLALMTGTREKESRRLNVKEWVNHWTLNPRNPWQLKVFEINGGTHAASIGESYRQAMLWFFQKEMEQKKK